MRQQIDPRTWVPRHGPAMQAGKRPVRATLVFALSLLCLTAISLPTIVVYHALTTDKLTQQVHTTITDKRGAS